LARRLGRLCTVKLYYVAVVDTLERGKQERESSAYAMATIIQELDDLYIALRGARYANALGDAKKAFQEKNYVEALRLVRDTGELHRRMHLQVLKQDPRKLGGGKKEAQRILEKQDKVKAVLARFDELVKQLDKMAKLTPEPPKTPPSARPLPVAQIADDGPIDGGEEAAGKGPAVAAYIIDSGSFTQLQTAAQQSGLVPNADAIGFVRDHEFREGKYQEAFDRIAPIQMHLKAAAEGRAKKLRQEEVDFKSNILDISLKDWLIKRQRDTAQTQVIDRTLRYFAIMLDGLRVMIAASYDDEPVSPIIIDE
jgi:hypothetical protein